MPDVTIIDISTGVKTTWAAAGSLTAIVPASRLYFGRAAEGSTLPYTVFGFEDISAFFGGTEYFSGAPYIKQTRILFDTYGTRATSWDTLAQAMGDVFGWSVNDPNASWSIPNAEKVVSCLPEVEGLELTEERVDGEDVLKYSSSFTLTIQANRG